MLLYCIFLMYVLDFLMHFSMAQYLYNDSFAPANDVSCQRIEQNNPFAVCACKSPAAYWSLNVSNAPPLKSCCWKATHVPSTFYKSCMPRNYTSESGMRYIGPGHGYSHVDLKRALQGRQVTIVGDSVSRQWYESLACYLNTDWKGWSSVGDPHNLDTSKLFGISRAKYRHNTGQFGHSSFQVVLSASSNQTSHENQEELKKKTDSKDNETKLEQGVVSFFSSNPIMSRDPYDVTMETLERLISSLLSSLPDNININSSSDSSSSSNSSSSSSSSNSETIGIISSETSSATRSSGSSVSLPLQRQQEHQEQHMIVFGAMHEFATFRLAATCRRLKAHCVFAEYIPDHFYSEVGMGFNRTWIQQPCETNGYQHWCSRRGRLVELWENTKGFLKIPCFDAYIARPSVHIDSLPQSDPGVPRRKRGMHTDCRHLYSDTSIFEPMHLGLLHALLGHQLPSSFDVYG